MSQSDHLSFLSTSKVAKSPAGERVHAIFARVEAFQKQAGEKPILPRPFRFAKCRAAGSDHLCRSLASSPQSVNGAITTANRSHAVLLRIRCRPSLNSNRKMHVLDSAWETVTKEFDAARQQSALAARSDAAHDVNQLLRRLRAYRSEAEWSASVLDGAAKFASHIALFSFRDGLLRLLGERNLNLPAGAEIAPAATPAFASVIGTKDTVVTLRTASEVGEVLASAERGKRAYLLPILNGPRVVAVLFSASEQEPDANALELIAGLASIVLERRSNTSLHMQIEVAPSPTPALPAWAALEEKQRNLHLHAQRFARVKVAEMQLFKPDASRSGLEQANLYLFLRPEIDLAREAFRKQFMTVPSMVDYLHLELVRTAAQGNELKLGVDYPGPLL